MGKRIPQAENTKRCRFQKLYEMWNPMEARPKTMSLFVFVFLWRLYPSVLTSPGKWQVEFRRGPRKERLIIRANNSLPNFFYFPGSALQNPNGGLASQNYDRNTNVKFFHASLRNLKRQKTETDPIEMPKLRLNTSLSFCLISWKVFGWMMSLLRNLKPFTLWIINHSCSLTANLLL